MGNKIEEINDHSLIDLILKHNNIWLNSNN